MPCCGGPSDWPAPRYHWQSERQAPPITRGQPWHHAAAGKAETAGTRRFQRSPRQTVGCQQRPGQAAPAWFVTPLCSEHRRRQAVMGTENREVDPEAKHAGVVIRLLSARQACQLGVSSFRCSHPLRRSSSWSLCGGIGTSGPGFRASGWDTLIEVGLENPPCQAARTTARRRTFFGPMKTRVRWPDGERRSLRRARGRSHRLLASMGTGATGQR